MDEKDRERAIEESASAWRPTSHLALPVHPSWYDLDAEGREQAFEVARRSRLMEAALDSQGWSSTVHAVLQRLPRSPRLDDTE